MALTDYTKNILNIEDKNIYFYDDCFEIKKMRRLSGLRIKNAPLRLLRHKFHTRLKEVCENRARIFIMG